MAAIRKKAKAKKKDKPKDTAICNLLARHFGRVKPEELTVSERLFPFRVRADLQKATESVVADGGKLLRFCGVHLTGFREGIDLPALMVRDDRFPPVAATPQYEELDIGDEIPVRCLKIGLWLLEREGLRYAILLSMATKYGSPTGVRFQIATSTGTAGAAITDRFFKALEKGVNECRSYRGKILSLEESGGYSGQSTAIRVHRLKTVRREQIILPLKTLNLLERNLIRFVQTRQRLSEFGQTTRKGVLFYGPPGTGKTYTIHYLADALKGHTMLLITANQIGLLGEYMSLARLLQPSLVVIEDVDLIAPIAKRCAGLAKRPC